MIHFWHKFKGKYRKEYYDIKTHDGLYLSHCWANNGGFVTRNGVFLKGEFIAKFKRSRRQ